MRTHRSHRTGMTLMELVLVLAILVALGALVIPLVVGGTDTAQRSATEASMVRIRNVIMATPEHTGYLQDVGVMPRTMRDLFIANPLLPTELLIFNPITRRGWRGPYLADSSGRYLIAEERGFSTAYGQNNDPGIRDGWGNPLVIQWPTGDATGQYARLVSAGPDGILNTPLTKLMPSDLTVSDRSDDLILFLRVADIHP